MILLNLSFVGVGYDCCVKNYKTKQKNRANNKVMFDKMFFIAFYTSIPIQNVMNRTFIRFL